MSAENRKGADAPKVKDGLVRLGLSNAVPESRAVNARIRGEMESNEKIAREAKVRME